MKKILLIAVNARYSHSSLALLCLKHAAFNRQAVITKEYNINDSVMDIAADIVAHEPDMAGFSCYIWNIEHVVKIASVVKSVCPHCLIVFGGPEVSFGCEALMAQWPFVDVIVRGAGETPFAYLSKSLAKGQSIESTPSACIRTSGGMIITPDAKPFQLADQPFLYGDLTAFENKMIYYETSRGCPFRCAYCMSAGEALDFLPMERVQEELEHFMHAGVQQIKLVDRTFNHPDARAQQIWSWLIALRQKYPLSSTNFHFEVSANLLSEQTIRLLATAPPGLIQLEIGIQSTHGETLSAVNRAHNTRLLLQNTAALCRLSNLRVYVDLIAGLPMETPDSFARSFNDAYSLGANRLQLGFLKLLRGSRMRENAESYGIVYTDHAPYEVLKTGTMTFDDLCRLHRIEQVLDSLYNERQTEKTLALLIREFKSPFAFFDNFTHYLDDTGYFARPQKKQTMFEQLFCFAKQKIDETLLREALSYDWLTLNKPAIWPEGISVPLRNVREADSTLLPEGLSIKEASRRYVLAEFSCLFNKPCTLIFDYTKTRDDDGFIQIKKET